MQIDFEGSLSWLLEQVGSRRAHPFYLFRKYKSLSNFTVRWTKCKCHQANLALKATFENYKFATASNVIRYNLSLVQKAATDEIMNWIPGDNVIENGFWDSDFSQQILTRVGFNEDEACVMDEYGLDRGKDGFSIKTPLVRGDSKRKLENLVTNTFAR